jgi:formate dehydrogenase iron-sulfur subunit
VLDHIIANEDRDKNLRLLDDLCELMLDGSLCALGGLTPYPVLSALQHFPDDFTKPAPLVQLSTPLQENARRH